MGDAECLALDLAVAVVKGETGLAQFLLERSQIYAQSVAAAGQGLRAVAQFRKELEAAAGPSLRVDLHDERFSTVTAAEKIAAFDKIAKSIATNYAIDHLEDNVQYINSDLDHYVWEEAMQSVLGQRIFDFYNATYEGT